MRALSRPGSRRSPGRQHRSPSTCRARRPGSEPAQPQCPFLAGSSGPARRLRARPPPFVAARAVRRTEPPPAGSPALSRPRERAPYASRSSASHRRPLRRPRSPHSAQPGEQTQRWLACERRAGWGAQGGGRAEAGRGDVCGAWGKKSRGRWSSSSAGGRGRRTPRATRAQRGQARGGKGERTSDLDAVDGCLAGHGGGRREGGGGC